MWLRQALRVGKDGRVRYWAKVSPEWKPGLSDPQCQSRNKDGSLFLLWNTQKETWSLKMLLSDNFYSFTLFIDYKRPLKLTHLRLGDDTVSADGNMKSQEEPAQGCVCDGRGWTYNTGWQQRRPWRTHGGKEVMGSTPAVQWVGPQLGEDEVPLATAPFRIHTWETIFWHMFSASRGGLVSEASVTGTWSWQEKETESGPFSSGSVSCLNEYILSPRLLQFSLLPVPDDLNPSHSQSAHLNTSFLGHQS